MTRLSFSTMWAQQERFADLARFRSAVAAMGYDAIEVSHSTDEAGLNVLLRSGDTPRPPPPPPPPPPAPPAPPPPPAATTATPTSPRWTRRSAASLSPRRSAL